MAPALDSSDLAKSAIRSRARPRAKLVGSRGKPSSGWMSFRDGGRVGAVHLADDRNADVGPTECDGRWPSRRVAELIRVPLCREFV